MAMELRREDIYLVRSRNRDTPRDSPTACEKSAVEMK